MSGGPSIAAPRPPADSPGWCVGLVRDLVDWVHQIRRGPQSLTGYSSGMRPAAANFARAFIFDTTNGIPLSSDDTGVWNNVPSYVTGGGNGVSATINARAGKLTTTSLATPAGGAQTLSVANTFITPSDLIIGSVANGTNTAGVPMLGQIVPASGAFTAEIRNIHSSAALNGTLVFSFFVLKA